MNKVQFYDPLVALGRESRNATSQNAASCPSAASQSPSTFSGNEAHVSRSLGAAESPPAIIEISSDDSDDDSSDEEFPPIHRLFGVKRTESGKTNNPGRS
jgi:hypothetical protein